MSLPDARSVQRYAFVALALVLVVGGIFLLRPRQSDATVELVETAPAVTPAPELLVDVAGAVARPGVVRLAAGARVLDAIAAAGGTTAGADTSALNRAAPVRDGDRLYVPRHGEPIQPGAAGAIGDDRIDLNRASPRELELLPGVGPGTASRIVRAREQRPFARVEELQTRGIVSARVLEDVRDLVVVR